MELFTLFAIVILIAFWYQSKYYRRNGLLHKIPAIRSYPLIGSNLSFVGKSPAQLLVTLQEAFDEHGPLFRFDLTPFHSGIVVADPKVAEGLLSSQKLTEKSVEYDFFKSWLGDGLLLSNGQKWHQRRKIITPSFHFKILEQFTEIMEGQGKVFVSNMKKHEGQQVDFFPLISLYALDVICESAMGCKINAQTDISSEYVKAIKEISDIIFMRSLNPLKGIDWIYRWTSMYRQQQKALKTLHEFTLSVIMSRQKDLQNSTTTEVENNEDDNELGIKKKIAFLDLLLKSTIDGQPLSIDDIREEVDTFMFEGHDTTASGIAFAFYNIAKHPEVQQKVFEECRATLGDDLNAHVTMQSLNSLNYLELVIKESLRLYPSVPFFGRKMNEEVMIGNIIVPENTSVNIAPYFLGRNPQVFDDPLKFDPSRFDVETTTDKTNPFAYVPFSAGPRNCIGQKFAMLEMKSIVSKVVRNFELSISKENEKLELIASLILRPENGINLDIKQRVYS